MSAPAASREPASSRPRSNRSARLPNHTAVTPPPASRTKKTAFERNSASSVTAKTYDVVNVRTAPNWSAKTNLATTSPTTQAASGTRSDRPAARRSAATSPTGGDPSSSPRGPVASPSPSALASSAVSAVVGVANSSPKATA